MNTINTHNHSSIPQGIADAENLNLSSKIAAGALSAAARHIDQDFRSSRITSTSVPNALLAGQLQSSFQNAQTAEDVIRTARSPAMLENIMKHAATQGTAHSQVEIATHAVDSVYSALDQLSARQEAASARLDQLVVEEAVAMAKDPNNRKAVTKEFVDYLGLVGNDLPKDTVKAAQRSVIALLNDDNKPLDVTAMVVQLMAVMQQIRNQANASKIKQRELAYKLAMESAKQIEKEGATKFAASLTQGVISIGMATMAIRDTRKAYNDSKVAKENTIDKELGGVGEGVRVNNNIKTLNDKITDNNQKISKTEALITKIKATNQNSSRVENKLNKLIGEKSALEEKRTTLLDKLGKAEKAGDKVADGIRDPLLAEANYKRALGDGSATMVSGTGSLLTAGQQAEKNRIDAEHSVTNNLQQETDKLYNNQSDNMAQINQFLEQYLRGQQEALSHVIRMV